MQRVCTKSSGGNREKKRKAKKNATFAAATATTFTSYPSPLPLRLLSSSAASTLPAALLLAFVRLFAGLGSIPAASSEDDGLQEMRESKEHARE